jgi:S1-C subfamily serine protease
MKNRFRKNLKAALCLMTTALMLAGFSVPAFASFDNETRDGVVSIQWSGPYIADDGSIKITSGSSGTGFFVGDGEAQYIVTNYHVADSYINVDQVVKDNFDVVSALYKKTYGSNEIEEYQATLKNAKSLFPLHAVYGDNDYEEVYEVAYNKEKDLAILRLNAPTDKRKPLALQPLSEDLAGKEVYAVGYPAVADRVKKSLTSYGKNDVTVTTGIINRIITIQGTGMKVYQTDAKIRGGNSGGPLVDEYGNVLGINYSSATEAVDPNLNYAICVDELLPLLTNNNIPYQLASNAIPASNPNPVSDSETTPVPAPELAPDSNDLTDYWWVLLIVIGVVGAFFIIKQRGKAAPAAAPQIVQPAVPAVSNASVHLICNGGHFAGTTFPVNGSLSIGRDPKRCQVVFPSDTKGISSLHCEVSVQPSGVWLTDKSSTYGTFLSGGRKLNAGESVQIRSGDSFYLADPKNEFKIL